MNAPQPAPEKRQRPAWLERLGAFVLACVVGAIRLMPLSLARGLARLAGWSFWFLGGTRLTEVDRNLRIAFGPGLEPARRKAIARAYWMHFGASVVEACHLKHWDAARARREVDVTAIETLAARWAPGRGCS
ncbi:MAG: hypothetical protein M5U26_23790 [Planctomycetota bacterium]|nr:hypothetical protein [Planctomycetota bacterium]